MLEIGRADLPRRDNLWAWIKPRRPVPPGLVFEAAGRIAVGTGLFLLACAALANQSYNPFIYFRF